MDFIGATRRPASRRIDGAIVCNGKAPGKNRGIRNPWVQGPNFRASDAKVADFARDPMLSLFDRRAMAYRSGESA
jgi:hypothetical protein